MDLQKIKKLCNDGKIKWSRHALKRLRERKITTGDFEKCILDGEIIENYPDDYPLPSCLILGWVLQSVALHVVIGTDGDYIYAITAYYPDFNTWEPDMKTRKEK